jgi:hypothetical protein
MALPVSVYNVEFNHHTVAANREQQGKRLAVVMDSNTAVRLVMPKTSTAAAQNTHHFLHTITIPLKQGELCNCSDSPSFILVAYIAPISTFYHPQQIQTCYGTHKPPVIFASTVQSIRLLWQQLLSPACGNHDNLQLAIIWVHFLQDDWRLCYVLSSLSNGVLVVVPVDDTGALERGPTCGQ